MAMKGSRPETRFVLVGLAGPTEGIEFPIGAKTVVGRAAESDVRIADDQVSRRHVELTIVEDGRSYVRAEDLKSRNGLHVNGHRVQATLLDDGDHVVIGRAVFRLDRRQAHEGASDVFGDILQPLRDWAGPGVSAQGGPVR